MATGSSSTIRWRREQKELQRLIHINALNHAAIDRYNELSRLLERTAR